VEAAFLVACTLGDVEDDHSGFIHLVLPAALLVQIAGRQRSSARAQADGERVAPSRSG
jgi:hypothetical protein